ncbi:hypothetical protein J2X98_004501 [Pseudarthrobacter enclensis]|uniref:Uncharacterized protein n=1 Tax=Pseudarthrobacter enclensis TaxID=993070 RepID=A0ABT9S054_9MICC|nr:hypothetical protein [Pseudarthrobacter enclensis]
MRFRPAVLRSNNVREPWTDGLSACPRGMCITTKRLPAHDKNTFAEKARSW